MTNQETVHFFSTLIDLMRKLRGPQGCAWNRAQTFESLKSYLIEESYELLDAVDGVTKNSPASADAIATLRDELGDLLLEIVFLGSLAEEKGWFDLEEIPQVISEKIIRRHPHVFGDKKATSPDEVARLWEEVKASEKRNKPIQKQSVLSGVPRTMPSLLRAQKVSEKAAANGFYWSNASEVLAKVEEEIRELKEWVGEDRNSPSVQKKLKHELGDILFSICNLAGYFKLSAEDSLHQGVERFQERFSHIEKSLADQKLTLSSASRPLLESLWNEAKLLEK